MKKIGLTDIDGKVVKTITPLSIWKDHLKMMGWDFTDRQAELLMEASERAKWNPDLRNKYCFLKIIKHLSCKEYLEFMRWRPIESEDEDTKIGAEMIAERFEKEQKLEDTPQKGE